MDTDAIHALQTIAEEAYHARRSWVKLPSGTRVNLDVIAVAVMGVTYGGDREALQLYGPHSDSLIMSVIGDDIDVLLCAIDARLVLS